MPFDLFLDWIACFHGYKNRKSLIRHQKVGMNSGFSGMEWGRRGIVIGLGVSGEW
ncbi:hypothetical protein [uncultured Algoriphagus sp.]|uniref:hypothetical protein n=1 Tax=uncultured Algoriphagus sp. TaxID=417365 RepID=UPI002589BD3C|nr:hypothetical protein [uncultured Algoriphagus sp.]